MPIRAVIYARYSSENQREASIEDQVRLCRERIESEGWELVQVFRDAGISGASTFLRHGYQALLEGARSSEFEVVVAEALDRLSRDQEDVAALFKRMRFAGIRIFTLSEGEVTELHVGLKGTMNALFLKDLALKTHRGLRGRVEAGRAAGGISYGYRVVRRVDERGELIRGERAIDEVEATVVRRIFGMFAGGASPIAIAKQLNAEGIRGPEGRAWQDTTIRGHALRATGILRNELYIGRLVWNRMCFVKDPHSGKRISRMNPPERWIREDVPELRIVDQATWEQVQARLGAIREASGADRPDRRKFWEKRRPQHVLSGKVFCACCGGAMAAIGRDYLACRTARRQGTCGNKQGIRRDALETVILSSLRDRLMQPEHVAIFVEEFTAEWNRLQAEHSAGYAARHRELEAVNRKLDGLIDAIANGLKSPGLQQKLDDLEARKAHLQAQLERRPTSSTARLHPNLAAVYRERVAKLHEALRNGSEGPAILEQVRGLIDRVVLHQSADGNGLEIELIGEISSMIDLALGRDGARERHVPSADRDLFSRSVKVVAGRGFEPLTFRL
jgi:site-specific DNA recombinase